MFKAIRYGLMGIMAGMLFTCTGITNAIRPLVISDSSEIALGAKFKTQMLADTLKYPQSKNMIVTKYIDSIGQIIAHAQTDRINIPFTFTVIDDTIINAFSLLGGPVFIYTGLLKRAGSGAEVAGVLAHEIGHITMHHGANRLVQAEGIGVVNQILFGSDSTITGTIATLLENLAFLKYSRDDEYQADSCGVTYNSLAGYNPYGMKNFFDTLQHVLGDTGSFDMFSDHPNTSSRIDKVKTTIGKLTNTSWSATDTTGLHIGEFAAIRSRL